MLWDLFERSQRPPLEQASLGNYSGNELRVHATRELGRVESEDSFLALGFAPTLEYVVGNSEWSRWRVPSLLGLLLPEVGIAYRSSGSTSMYSALTAPFSFLLTDSVGVEAVATGWVFYSSRFGALQAIGSVAIGLVYRGPTPHRVVW